MNYLLRIQHPLVTASSFIENFFIEPVPVKDIPKPLTYPTFPSFYAGYTPSSVCGVGKQIM
jgi:hypothetical protein